LFLAPALKGTKADSVVYALLLGLVGGLVDLYFGSLSSLWFSSSTTFRFVLKGLSRRAYWIWFKDP
jgi:hypothetical protein